MYNKVVIKKKKKDEVLVFLFKFYTAFILTYFCDSAATLPANVVNSNYNKEFNNDGTGTTQKNISNDDDNDSEEDNEDNNNNNNDDDNTDDEVEELTGYHFIDCVTLFVCYTYVNSGNNITALLL